MGRDYCAMKCSFYFSFFFLHVLFQTKSAVYYFRVLVQTCTDLSFALLRGLGCYFCTFHHNTVGLVCQTNIGSAISPEDSSLHGI